MVANYKKLNLNSKPKYLTASNEYSAIRVHHKTTTHTILPNNIKIVPITSKNLKIRIKAAIIGDVLIITEQETLRYGSILGLFKVICMKNFLPISDKTTKIFKLYEHFYSYALCVRKTAHRNMWIFNPLSLITITQSGSDKPKTVDNFLNPEKQKYFSLNYLYFKENMINIVVKSYSSIGWRLNKFFDHNSSYYVTEKLELSIDELLNPSTIKIIQGYVKCHFFHGPGSDRSWEVAQQLIDFLVDTHEMAFSDKEPKTQSARHGSDLAYEDAACAQGLLNFGVGHDVTMEPEAKKAITSLSKSLKTISKLNGLSKLSDVFSSLVGCLTGGITFKIDGLEEILKRVDSLVGAFKEVILFVLVLFAIKTFFRFGMVSDFTLSIISTFLLIAGITDIIGKDVWKRIWKCATDAFALFKVSEKVSCQASIGDTGTAIEAFMLCLQTLTIGKAAFGGGDITTAFVKSTKGWDRMKVDFSENMNSWFTIVQKYFDWLMNKLNKKPWIVWEGKYPELYKAIDDAHNFVDNMMKDSTLTYSTGRKLEQVLRTLREVQRDLPSHAIHERNIANATIASLGPWKVKLGKANFLGNGPRVKPVAILFTGPSQVGKSECNSIFTRAVAARVLPSDRLKTFVLNPSSEIYNRIIEQEYWDAWADQSAIQFDEIGARKDMVGQNNAAFESLRIINSAPFSLHAADIESKGMINARPFLVTGTSNMMRFDWKSLTFPQAFEKRYTTYAVIPKDEYRLDKAEKFDFSRCHMKDLQEEGVWLDDFRHLEFWEYDLTIARLRGEIGPALLSSVPLSYEQVKELTIKRVINNIAYGESILKKHDEMIRNEILKRKDYSQIQKDIPSCSYQVKTIIEKYNLDNKDNESIIDEYNSSFSKEYDGVMTQGSFDFKKKYDDAKLVLGSLGAYALLNISSSYNNKRYDIGDAKSAFFQAASDVKFEREECGDCIVCNAHCLNTDELTERSSFRYLFPDCAKHLERAYAHVILSDQEREDELHYRTSGFPRPSCLKLKRNIVDETGSIISYMNSPEEYAFCIARHITSYRKKMGEDTCKVQREIINKALDIKDLGKGFMTYDWKITLGILTALGTMCYGIYKFVCKITPQSISGRSGRSSKRVSRVTKVTKVPQNLEMQSAKDGVVDNIMNKVLSRCQFRIGHVKQEKPIGSFTMVGGGVGFMPMHFAQMLEYAKTELNSNPTYLSVLNGDWTQRVEIPYESFDWFIPEDHDGANADVIYFYLPMSVMQPTPDIVKYFVKNDDFPEERFFGALYLPRIVGRNVILSKEAGFILPNVEISYSDGSATIEPFHLTDAFKYHFGTQEGDCGSLLIKYSATGDPQRILGLHVSGTIHGANYSQSISFEDIATIHKFLVDKNNPDVIEVETFEGPLIKPVIQGFANLGKTKGPRPPDSTDIVKSPLHNEVYDCMKLPARLTWFTNIDGDRVHPMEKARKTYMKPDVYIDFELLQVCVSSTINHITNNSTQFDGLYGPKVLSFEEAVYGILGHDFLCGVKMSTASGFPRCMESNDYPGTKKKWLGLDDQQNRPKKTDPAYCSVVNEVQSIIYKAERGTRVLHYFSDFLKNERRSIKKVEAGITRFISGTAMAYLIVCIMYFGALSEWLMSNRIYNGMALGINAFSEEWNSLAKHMHMGNDDDENYLDGDFSSFDGSHSRQIMFTFHDLCDSFYGNRCRIRRVLLEDLLNSVHIYDGCIYIWGSKLPSGHPLTPIINCWVNLLLHRISYVKTSLRLAPESDMSDALIQYNKYVVTEVYGDDNMHYISGPAKEIFTMENHARSMWDIGYVYTDARKSSKWCDKFLAYKDITFLKRSFRRHDTLPGIIAPLSTETLFDMIQWTKKKDVNNFESFKSTINKILMELAFHDRETYSSNKNKIVLACLKFMKWSPTTYNYRIDAAANASRIEYL